MFTYKYKKFGPRPRPVISVILKHGKQVFESMALVDSGSDICLFNFEVARSLGITIKPEHQRTVGGLSGINNESFVYPVKIKINDHEYKTKVSFMKNVSGTFNYGIIGQTGFFDHFIVRFDHRKREVALKWNR